MRFQSILLFGAAVMVAGCAAVGQKTDDGVTPIAVAPVEPVRPEVARRADLMYELLVGEIAGKEGRIEEATEHYLKASKLSNDPKIAARTARIAAFSRDFEVALKAAKRWVALEPDSVEANQVAGLLMVRDGRPEEAAHYLGKVIELGGKDKYELGFARISLLMARQTVSEAELKTMALLRDRFPDVSHAHRSYAEVAYRAGKYEEALSEAQRALDLDPGDESAKILKNRVLLAMGRVDEALDGMRRLAAESPDDAELAHGLARMLVQANRYEEAHEQYLRTQELQPGNFDVLYSLALLEVELKRYDDAVKNLQKLAKSPTHADDAHYYLGRVEEERQHYDMAMSWYLRIKSGERYLDAQTRVATILAKLGKQQEAIAHLEQLRRATTDEAAVVRLDLAQGDIYRAAGDYQQAYDFYSRALEKRPNNIDLLYARAMTAEKLGHIEWLERDLKTIIKLEPDNATALNALGYTLADHGKNLQEALDFIKRALALRPDDAAILDSMGWVNYRLGNLEEAEKYLSRALNKLEDPEIASHLAEVQFERGKRDKAIETVQKGLKVAPEDARLLRLKQKIEP